MNHAANPNQNGLFLKILLNIVFNECNNYIVSDQVNFFNITYKICNKINFNFFKRVSFLFNIKYINLY
jgi:hypothetical protein